MLPSRRKHGFNLLAWIIPVALPLGALLLVWELVRRWKRRATLVPAGGLRRIDPAFLQRVERESETEDLG